MGGRLILTVRLSFIVPRSRETQVMKFGSGGAFRALEETPGLLCHKPQARSNEHRINLRSRFGL
jgi:hypothetical protein